MLLVVLGQAKAASGRTSTRASFPCGLWAGLSMDARLTCVFSSKSATAGAVRQNRTLTFPMSDFRFLGFQTCAKSLRVASICFVQSCFVSNGTEMHLGEGEVWKMDPPAPFSKFGSF
jgi:hypothetical protein